MRTPSVADIPCLTRCSVFLNGLTNALKFCKNGPIEISLSRCDTKLVTSINDRGIGLDQEELHFLTAPFTKASDHSPGAGLGLHIARRLMREMGGELRITSNMEDGTTFRFTLPDAFPSDLEFLPDSCADSVVDLFKGNPSVHTGGTAAYTNVPVAQEPAAPPSAATESRMTEPLRVLVVDDNMVCRRILIKLLKRCPGTIEPAEADNGSTALDVFPDFAPHLVLTDVSMPIMDGVTSAQHMRRITTERHMDPCKIYAITGLGHSDPRLKAAGLRGTADLDGWLVKGQDDLAAISRIVSELRDAKHKKLKA